MVNTGRTTRSVTIARALGGLVIVLSGILFTAHTSAQMSTTTQTTTSSGTTITTTYATATTSSSNSSSTNSNSNDTTNNIVTTVVILAIDPYFPLCEIVRPLTLGSTGEDVRCLQRYLNYAGFSVAAAGPGSRGLESQYFGTFTRQAVMRWQNTFASQVLSPSGIVSGTGYWGPLSQGYYVRLAKIALRVP